MDELPIIGDFLLLEGVLVRLDDDATFDVDTPGGCRSISGRCFRIRNDIFVRMLCSDDGGEARVDHVGHHLVVTGTVSGAHRIQRLRPLVGEFRIFRKHSGFRTRHTASITQTKINNTSALNPMGLGIASASEESGIRNPELRNEWITCCWLR